jgi:chromosome segregation ATPase
METLQIVMIAIGSSLGGGGAATLETIQSTRLRSPADDQARLELGFKVLEDRLTEANADRAVLKSTSEWMRQELDKRDKDKSADFEEKSKLYERIEELNARIVEKNRIIDEFEDRITRLATKAGRGELITVEDIFGTTAADLESTITRSETEHERDRDMA